ncbi:MAG: ANTAR domain-containing protein [Lachnospiraceae bacterium]|nr:ANTAR domain-containing protein [Lachnospiraceae bacterium]
MNCIIVLMPGIEEARKIGGLLNKHGYPPDLVCTLAADALSLSCRMDDGVIICGSRLNDLSFIELQDCIPKYFRLIILSRNVMNEEYPEEALKLEMPLRISELIGAIEAEADKYYIRPKDNKVVRHARSNEERKYIDKAKALLMKNRSMTEQEAYRYIQKMSMDSGNTMTETAQMILLLGG